MCCVGARRISATSGLDRETSLSHVRGPRHPRGMPDIELTHLSLGLPDGWFRIMDPEIIRRLQQAVKDFTARYGRDRRVSSWIAVLFLLWQRDVIEVRGRCDYPDEPPEEIDYPVSERFWHPELGFELASGRLRYRPSGRVYYDVQARVRTWGLAPPSFRSVADMVAFPQPADSPLRGSTQQKQPHHRDREHPSEEARIVAAFRALPDEQVRDAKYLSHLFGVIRTAIPGALQGDGKPAPLFGNKILRRYLRSLFAERRKPKPEGEN